MINFVLVDDWRLILFIQIKPIQVNFSTIEFD